jgi:hypothetical protein
VDTEREDFQDIEMIVSGLVIRCEKDQLRFWKSICSEASDRATWKDRVWCAEWHNPFDGWNSYRRLTPWIQVPPRETGPLLLPPRMWSYRTGYGHA